MRYWGELKRLRGPSVGGSAQAYNYSRNAGNAPAKGTSIKTKSTTIASFLFSSFPSLGSFLSPFLFLRYCDFGASRAYHKEACLLTPFHSLDWKFR